MMHAINKVKQSAERSDQVQPVQRFSIASYTGSRQASSFYNPFAGNRVAPSVPGMNFMPRNSSLCRSITESSVYSHAPGKTLLAKIKSRRKGVKGENIRSAARRNESDGITKPEPIDTEDEPEQCYEFQKPGEKTVYDSGSFSQNTALFS